MSNNHGITSVTPKVFKPVCNGKAVFPKVASLLNHSCNPNTSVVVQKDVQITYATKTIYPGEEICHIYNNHFADSPKDKRQAAMLKDYHFQCSCLACENNYELFENLPKDFDNDDYRKADEQSKVAFQAENYPLATKYQILKMKIASEHLQDPHQILVRERGVLIECIFRQFGNKTFLTADK